MRRDWVRVFGMLLLAGLPLLTVLGCPNSEIVKNKIGVLMLEASMSPADTGRYDVAILGLQQVTITPASLSDQDALGGRAIRMMSSTQNLLMNVPTQAIGSTNITSGNYSVDSVNLSTYRLEVTSVPAPPPTNCVQSAVDLLTEPLSSLLVPFDGSFVVSVPTQGTTSLSIVVDVPGLISYIESLYPCRDILPCGIFPDLVAPPCINGDPEDPDPDVVQTFLSFE